MARNHTSRPCGNAMFVVEGPVLDNTCARGIFVTDETLAQTVADALNTAARVKRLKAALNTAGGNIEFLLEKLNED